MNIRNLLVIAIVTSASFNDCDTVSLRPLLELLLQAYELRPRSNFILSDCPAHFPVFVLLLFMA